MFSSRKSNGVHGGNPTLGTKSLRFRSSASASLSRTPATATNRTTWTWSGWVKRGTFSSRGTLLSAGSDGSNELIFYFENANTLVVFNRPDGTNVQTTQVFRDPSAWYHIVLVWDTTQTTASNRLRLYINGVQVTSFSTTTYPASSGLSAVNNNITHYLGQLSDGLYYDGYMADVYLIDGQALTPSSFGSTNGTTGQWSPAQYTGTFGTNGFYLPFNNATSTTTLGYDQSGNSNNWTTTGISLSAGSTYDSMNDVPVAYSATAANYAVLNPLSILVGTITNGNLSGDTGTTNGGVVYGSINIPSSGKWYWEFTQTNTGVSYSGIETIVSSTSATTPNNVWYVYDGTKIVNGTSSSYGASYGNNDTIGVAVNVDSGTITFYKNGTSQGAITYATASISVTPSWRDGSGSASISFNANFGQQPFIYTPPSGYNALNTYNLPTPAILQGNKYFNPVLYTGNNSNNNAITVGFQPDFVWIKSRSNAYDNNEFDVLRGRAGLVTNTSAAEVAGGPSNRDLVSFDANGFTVGPDYNFNVNTSGATFVSWNWKANGSGSSNTNGSITSTVSASTTAGFSIVTYTGNGSNGATVGHGLGKTPSMVIVKVRSTTNYWLVYHIGLTSAGYYIVLNSTNGQTADSTIWNSTAPTSSVFTLGTDSSTNLNAGTFVAYCFAPVAGFSAFGSYVGNGSTDGTFVYLGFRPAFILVKASSTTSPWIIYDTARNTYNSLGYEIYPNSSSAEAFYTDLNVLSNGFKHIQSGSPNSSGVTYIYACFASNPFAYSNAF